MLQTNYYFQKVVYIWAMLKKTERFKGSLMFKSNMYHSNFISIYIITFYLATLCETCFC